jgi:hypothetical protein
LPAPSYHEIIARAAHSRAKHAREVAMRRLWWLVFALVLSTPACSADRSFSAGEPAPAATSVPAVAGEDPAAGGDQPAAAVGLKLIRTARLDLLIEDYDAARPALERILAAAGGMISDAEISHYGAYLSAALTLRVPAESLDRVLRELRALGKVEHEGLGTEDVTRQYVDTDARLRNLTQTETRLRALLDSQTGNLSSILEVEREITRVRGEIEVLTSQLQQLDERVALSTIRLGLREEAPDLVHEPDDMWKPMRALGRNALAILEVSVGALVSFLAALAMGVLYLLPWLVPVALVLALKPRWRRGLAGLLRRRKRTAGAGPTATAPSPRTPERPGEPPADRS